MWLDTPASCISGFFFFVCFMGKVPTVPIVPGLRVADDEPVPCSIWVHRDLSDSTEWQHVDPTVQYFPVQFIQAACPALDGEG